MEMGAPTLSVGLPVYNGERFLEDALESILSQTYEDFELVISDNASTDRTGDICREYASKEPRIRYLRLENNIGAAGNFNRVIDLSFGSHFRWASHDDLCAPTCFERCMEVYESEQPVLVYPQTLIIDEQGAVQGSYEDGLDLRQPRAHSRVRAMLTRLTLCNPIFGVMPIEVLRQTRRLGAFPSSDEVLLFELALRGPFHEVPEPLFLRRLHEGRSTVAHASPEDRTAWFDPTIQKRRYFHRTKVFVEDLKSIGMAPIPAGERARTGLTLGRTYIPRWWRLMAREVQHAIVPQRKRIR
jgi:glycosyltransferase involved in cell wall biosynthesis